MAAHNIGTPHAPLLLFRPHHVYVEREIKFQSPAFLAVDEDGETGLMVMVGMVAGGDSDGGMNG